MKTPQRMGRPRKLGGFSMRVRPGGFGQGGFGVSGISAARLPRNNDGPATEDEFRQARAIREEWSQDEIDMLILAAPHDARGNEMRDLPSWRRIRAADMVETASVMETVQYGDAGKMFQTPTGTILVRRTRRGDRIVAALIASAGQEDASAQPSPS